MVIIADHLFRNSLNSRLFSRPKLLKDNHYWLLETLFSIWHSFGGHLRPYCLFETLFRICHPFHATFETSFVIWGPFQHLRPFSFNIWDLIGYLRPFSAFDTLLADSAAHMLHKNGLYWSKAVIFEFLGIFLTRFIEYFVQSYYIFWENAQSLQK